MVPGNMLNAVFRIVDRAVGSLQPELHGRIESNIKNATDGATIDLLPDVVVAREIMVAAAS